MTPLECEFESEALAAVIQSRWPEKAGAQLRAHVAGCQICADVTLAAQAIEISEEELRCAGPLPDSGRVWWLAQTRARREAVKTAGRPITVVQVLAFACAVGLMGACFGATSTWFQEQLRAAGIWWPTVVAALLAHEALAGGMAALIFVIPAAFYFVVSRD